MPVSLQDMHSHLNDTAPVTQMDNDSTRFYCDEQERTNYDERSINDMYACTRFADTAPTHILEMTTKCETVTHRSMHNVEKPGLRTLPRQRSAGICAACEAADRHEAPALSALTSPSSRDPTERNPSRRSLWLLQD